MPRLHPRTLETIAVRLSRRRSFVSMVESSHLGKLDYLAQLWSLDDPRRRGVAQALKGEGRPDGVPARPFPALAVALVDPGTAAESRENLAAVEKGPLSGVDAGAGAGGARVVAAAAIGPVAPVRRERSVYTRNSSYS